MRDPKNKLRAKRQILRNRKTDFQQIGREAQEERGGREVKRGSKKNSNMLCTYINTP